jgi:hypothetical protein
MVLVLVLRQLMQSIGFEVDGRIQDLKNQNKS